MLLRLVGLLNVEVVVLLNVEVGLLNVEVGLLNAEVGLLNVELVWSTEC